MYILTDWFLPCLYAFLACVGFCLVFNIHGPGILICCGGGALGWLVYLAMVPVTPHDILRYLVGAAVITLYSEIMARLRRCPVRKHLQAVIAADYGHTAGKTGSGRGILRKHKRFRQRDMLLLRLFYAASFQERGQIPAPHRRMHIPQHCN